ncbi:MAG TPA: hypothetical protein VK804_23265 [Bradyrhizobium sp.]|jgi:hypothetical protein|uniref:hypothetical protein n=1 Tax=Bradyrhizobium sp. TaxID=376 RepID=UPI002CF5D953|nr:hypothetical protein [Bradyrhizobium sp.]HTB03399.1 hypothetical protein [Bradyrhizobium sp.]
MAEPASALSAEASAFMDKLFDARGGTLLAFAQVEWFLAKIILEAKEFEQYQGIDLSFSQDAEKRASKVEALLDVKGPFTPYADKLRSSLDEVMNFVELRGFAAHGLLVRPEPDNFSLSSPIHFRMFRMFKGGELIEGKLNLTMKQYTDQQTALSTAARKFVAVVRKMWVELELKQLEPE